MASLALNEKHNLLNFMSEPFNSLSISMRDKKKGKHKLLKQIQMTSGAATWVDVKILKFSESKVEV